MKKILIFSLNYYPRFIGGAEVAIKEITDRVSPDEIEFHMVALRNDSNLLKDEKVGNVFVHRIGFTRDNPTISDLNKFPLRLLKHWYQFGAFFAALRLHKKYHFDCTWAMMAHSTGIPAGLLKTFKPNVKYLLTLQEGDPPEYIEKLARPVWPLFKRAFTKADALQPISTFLFNWGRRMGFKGEAEVIPNAVNIAHFSKEISSDERNKFRAKLGLTENDFILITTSRLVNKNAVDDVISSLVFLPEKVHFVVCGIGPDEEKLQELTVKNNLQSRVHFIGQIGHDELPKALKSCDIFIRPSRSEGMGNSFIEAMAAGVPVIATQEGGIADFLFDAKKNPEKETTGWAVDKDSPKQIAEAVKDIMENSEKVAFVTATAKKLVGEKYDWDTVAEKMKMVYNKLCK